MPEAQGQDRNVGLLRLDACWGGGIGKDMEYGYEITDTVGNKHFFVEGCTYCSMSTGGIHELHCPLSKDRQIVEVDPQADRFMDKNLKEYYRRKGLLYSHER